MVLDDRSFKASLPDAAHGIARAIERKDAEEFVVWTTPEERRRYALTPEKTKILLDWYHNTGATTSGLITYNGWLSAPKTYLEGAHAEIKPVSGQQLELGFHDGPRGYRCDSVSTLLAQGLSALTPKSPMKPSEECVRLAETIHRQGIRLEDAGFPGVMNGVKFQTWDEYEQSMLKVAAHYRALGR